MKVFFTGLITSIVMIGIVTLSWMLLLTIPQQNTPVEGQITAVGYWLEVYDGEKYVRFNVDYDEYKRYEMGGYYSLSENEN